MTHSRGARSSCSFCGIPGHEDAECRHRKKAFEHLKAQRSKKAQAKPKSPNGQVVKAINITDVFGEIPNTPDMVDAYPYDFATTFNSPPKPSCDMPVASGGSQAVGTCSRNTLVGDNTTPSVDTPAGVDRLCAMTAGHSAPPSRYDIVVDSGATLNTLQEIVPGSNNTNPRTVQPCDN